MKVECISIDGADVPEKSRFPGESADVRHEPLNVGINYLVFAILFYRDRVDYLVDAGGSGPDWRPSCLFSIKDGHMPSDLQVVDLTKDRQFDSLCQHFGARFMIGYEAITRDYQHFAGLIESDCEALEIFYREKIKRIPTNSFPDA